MLKKLFSMDRFRFGLSENDSIQAESVNQISVDVEELFPLKHWQVSLQDTHQVLQKITGETEKEFLAVGSLLQNICMQSDEISRHASNIGQLLSGDELSGISDELTQILSRLHQMLEELDRRMQIGSRVFVEISGHMKKLHDPVIGFQKLVKVLRMLSISTRIESARLKDEASGFQTLTANVNTLADTIDQKLGDIETHLDELEWKISSSLRNIDELKNEYGRTSGKIIEALKQSVSSIEDLRCNNLSQMDLIERNFLDLSSSVEEIVMSMQFHDITRQRLEHVEEAVEELVWKVEHQETEPDDRAAWSSLLIHNGKICQLQCSQLESSKNDFSTAVDHMENHLKNVNAQLTDVSSIIQECAGSSKRGRKSSAVEGLINGLELIEEHLKCYSTMCDTLKSAIRSIISTVSEMSQYVVDIEEIGLEIELIAVNSRIKATSVGAQGAALGVLAEYIQRVSGDARQKIIRMSRDFKNIEAQAKGLSTDLEIDNDDKCPQIQSEQILLQLKESAAHLVAVDNQVSPAMDDIHLLYAQVNEQVYKAVQMLNIRDWIEQSIMKSTETFRVINDSILSGFSPEDFDRCQSHDAIQAKGQYTMESERQVHNQLLGGDVQSSEDDVELFDDVLFSDTPDVDIELFDDPVPSKSAEGKTKTGIAAGSNVSEVSDQEDFDDNIELF